MLNPAFYADTDYVWRRDSWIAVGLKVTATLLLLGRI